MTETTSAGDPLALLEGVRRAVGALAPGTWAIREKHGRDISDEGWSETAVIAAPSGETVALTFMTGVLEAEHAEDNGAFIVQARRFMPRLLAGYDALLKLAAEFEVKSARLAATGDGDAESDAPGWAARAAAYSTAASRVRSVIAAALSGDEVPS